MDLDELVPLLDPTALPRVIGRTDALSRGLTVAMIERRLRSGQWRRVLPRTYLTVDTLTWRDRLDAALAFAGRGSLLSGAAVLCDAGLPSVPRPDRVLVLVPRSTRARSTRWVELRRTGRLPERDLGPGPARAPAARAVADHCLQAGELDHVRAVVAQAVRRRFCTIGELAGELAAGPRNGSGFLRRAIDEVTAGAWSAPEARAARLMRGAGLPTFEQNARIALPRGRYLVADFLWRQLRAVLEIDSDAHHLDDPADLDATLDRDLELQTLGFSVVHRRPAFIRAHPQRFVAGIAAWLDGRARLVS